MMCRGRMTVPVGLIFVVGCAAPPQSKSGSGRTPGQGQDGSRMASQVHAPGDFDSGGAVDTMIVNGESVKAVELCRERRSDLQSRAKSLPLSEYQGYVQRQSVQWITDKITDMLLYARASLHYPPEVQANIDKYVDGEIRKIVTAGHDGIQRRYEKYLASQGGTIEDVRAELRRQVIIASYLETEIKPQIAGPTRADLLAAFEANRDNYRKPPRRRMSLIDVRIADRLDDGVRSPSPQQMQDARDAAYSVITTAQAELRSGESFANVAGRYSGGLHKSEGGAWGWVTKGSVRERFEPAVEALYQLAGGEVSEVIEVDDGFLLVRCDEIDPGVEPSFQDVQLLLREAYSQDSYNRLLAELVGGLRSKAHVEPENLERFHAAVVKAALDREFTSPGVVSKESTN